MKAVRTSIFLVLVAIAAFASIAHAYPINAFDTKKGAYTTVQAAVAGSYINGKIYNPAAYVKVVIDKDLPSPYCLVVYYYSEWEDLSHEIHYQYKTSTALATPQRANGSDFSLLAFQAKSTTL